MLAGTLLGARRCVWTSVGKVHAADGISCEIVAGVTFADHSRAKRQIPGQRDVLKKLKNHMYSSERNIHEEKFYIFLK